MFEDRAMVEVEKSAPRVAVIGTGAIGSAVVHRLLGGGYDVTVWNRTESRATALVAAGALPARSVREAVSSTTLSFLTLKDYSAVEQCLAQLDMDLSGQTIVGMYTGRLAAQRVTALGAQYIHAGIQAPPEMIGTDGADLV
ncbi:NAD(P)-binding domain-containing protein [Micromonospora deserti]|uniref:6-phosphogluconate dehydrogenase NADP-binding domain-containing protein n=1 Tax=Micromonospora deserti TaxID=2070366 RepID=A0A2W2DEK0_9ACTN|nr:NAD(P)-binding domain-containing protein [Micromonospora deserti]PZG02339.1 hypothetical protein C1I99_03095 [Micromonospora deserti]